MVQLFHYTPDRKRRTGCIQCLLSFQWTYTAGNSWGCDPITGKCGLGEDPMSQEHFRACSDISIKSDGIVFPTPSPPSPSPPSPSPPSPSPPSPSPPSPSPPSPSPPSPSPPSPSPPSPSPPTPTPSPPSGGTCHAIGMWTKVPGMNNWCVMNCNHNPPFCPGHMCKCN